MAKASTGPKLVLYGPDDRYGAVPKKTFRQYIYFIRWYEERAKRERSTGTGDVQVAQQALADFINQQAQQAIERVEQERRGSTAPHELTVTDMLGLYLEHHAPHAAAPERIRYAIRNLIPWWDGVTVDGVTAGACRRYAAESSRAPATIRRELGTLAAAMTWCVTEGYLTQGGIVVLPPVPKDEQPFLTRPQAAKLLWAAWRGRKDWQRSQFRRELGGELVDNLHLPLFILIGLYHGARKEAILGLQWQPNTEGGYVDLDRGFIDFNPVGRAQTKKRRARVPIASRLLPWLRVARKVTRQFVIECHGKPITDLKKSFATAAVAAGLPKIHPHTLRHTCVTWLLRDGLDVWQVGGFVGMSPQTVQQVYGHHAPEFMAEAATSRRGKGDAGILAGIKPRRA